MGRPRRRRARAAHRRPRRGRRADAQDRPRRAHDRGRRRPLGRDRDVPARRRGLRLPVRRGDRRLARLRRRRGRLLGHDAVRRPRHEPRRLVGQRGRAEAARRQALHRLQPPAEADDRRAGRAPPRAHPGLARRRRGDRDADPGLPERRLPRARGLRHDGRRLHRAPEPRPHPASRLLGRPPASQGLARSAASPCSSRTRSDGRRRSRASRPGRSSDPVADAVGDGAVERQPGPARDQPRPQPPVHARRAAARRPPRRRDRGRPAQRARLRAHGHREEHRAEDVLEGDHVRPADGLPRRSSRARSPSAWRSRSCSSWRCRAAASTCA